MPQPSPRASPLDAVTRRFLWAVVLGASSGTLSMAWRAVLFVVAVTMGGCAMLPIGVERLPTIARRDLADTPLAKIAAASLPGGGAGQSGFRLLPDGREALAARLALIRRAEKTLDVQYYLIAGDATGREFLAELGAAAARGVRVRLLVDDLFAAGQDDLFAHLADQGGAEVRLFNPLPVRHGSFARRVLLSLHEFSRINRRMHNKLLIADGAFAITGGRNIADEYFDRGGDAHFIDMDVLSAGAVASLLEDVFDRYWNNDLAYPLRSLVDLAPPPTVVAGAAVAPTYASEATELDMEWLEGKLQLEGGVAEVLADPPGKARGDDGAGTVAQAHLALLSSARSEVLIASPYFLPGAPAMRTLAELRARDVAVSVLTNSLATTDEPLVHYVYARRRATLLAAGVELHELMPSASDAGDATAPAGDRVHGSSMGRLHTKLTVVDKAESFIGSMNIDARSERLNTEVGLVIHGEALAAHVASYLRTQQRAASYRLQLDGGRVTWRWLEGTTPRVLSIEPEATAKSSLSLRVLASFLGEGAL